MHKVLAMYILLATLCKFIYTSSTIVTYCTQCITCTLFATPDHALIPLYTGSVIGQLSNELVM